MDAMKVRHRLVSLLSAIRSYTDFMIDELKALDPIRDGKRIEQIELDAVMVRGKWDEVVEMARELEEAQKPGST